MYDNWHNYENYHTDAVQRDDYCSKMRNAGTWGGHPEIAALAHLFQININ